MNHGATQAVSRRGFLYGSGMAAGAAVMTACSAGGTAGSKNSDDGGGKAKGSAKKPVSAPDKFTESPDLAEKVKAKKIPKVEKRLPKRPYVIPHHWVEKGKYRGKLNMAALSSTGTAGASGQIQNFFYGYSPLRLLNDGTDVGPGTVEKWSSNKDASEWTLHFREGLRWSDGHPFTVDDVLFWWEDMVLPGNFAQAPSDWARSENGKLVKFHKVNDLTLKLIFDDPSPLLPTFLAAYSNGQNQDTWCLPKHYLKKYHPKYNKDVPKGWDKVGGLWEKKSNWIRNPNCPTLLGYKCKSFDSGKGVVLERNPYYWVVTKDGDQLPYIDEITINTVQKEQVLKLQVQQGKIDFCHGRDNSVTLSDVSSLSKSKDKGDFEILRWNSGSGTGWLFFLNYDHPDDELRKTFRDRRFRQAISYASNRKHVQKNIYYTTGELTTGTVSPSATEFVESGGKKHYQEWRDSHVEHDPDKAKKLLDEMGLKDADDDGFVELPSGKKLTVRLDYSSDISDEAAERDDRLVQDAKKVGLRMKRNPISPQSYDDQWQAGKLTARTNWEVSSVGSVLINGPLWMAPVEPSRWAPLEGKYFQLSGTKKEHKGVNKSNPWKSKPPRIEPEKDGPVAKLQKLLSKARVEEEDTRRKQLVWEMIKVHVKEGPFFMGCVANYDQVEIAKSDLKNVPKKANLAHGGLVNPYGHPSPGVYDPEVWFWKNPKDHS